MPKKPYYITTAIAYTSGKPHIGNTYEVVLADSIARYKRYVGYDVRFQTGTDEHGQKIEIKAFENLSTPKEFVDETSAEIKRIWDLMNTSYDKFIRTTDDYHEKQVQKIFKKLYDQGDIYKGEYEGMYCTPCESFFTKAQLVDGKCPDCGGDVMDAQRMASYMCKEDVIGKAIRERKKLMAAGRNGQKVDGRQIKKLDRIITSERSRICPSTNLVRTKPKKEVVSRAETYREDIRAPRGYHVVKELSYNGWTVDGYPYQHAVYERDG